jgi:bifunctional non-homologous end joining protein LigD
MRLFRRPDPFNDPQWIFELKLDGFRALAYLDNAGGRLVSRNGNTFGSFKKLAADVAEAFRGTEAVLDGEIVCLDERGYPQFEDLMFRRGELFFVAFDALWIDGEDLRNVPVLERKRRLRRVVPRGKRSGHRLRYLDHIEADGRGLYRLACERNLEGIVGKDRGGLYDTRRPLWVKIKNPAYTQAEGREELFEELHR